MNRSTGKEVYLDPAKYNFIKQKNREHDRQNAARRVGQRKRNNGASNFTDLATQTNKKDSIRRRSHHKGSREAGTRHRKKDVGGVYHRPEKTIMVEVCEVGHRQEPTHGCKFCGLIRNRYRGEVTKFTKLRKGIVGYYETPRDGKPTPQEPSGGPKGRRCYGARVTSNSDPKGNPGRMVSNTGARGFNRRNDCLENNVSLGGGRGAVLGQLHSMRPFNSNCGLEPDSEGKEGESVHGFKVRGNHRKMDGGDIQSHHEVGILRSFNKSRHCKAHRTLEEGFSHGKLQCSQHKTRCNKVHFREETDRISYSADAHKSTSQTRNGKPADIRNDVKICRVGQVAGSLPEHKPHNPTFVIPRTARRLMQNFTRKSKTTRLPSTEEERATPLHVKEVGTIDVQEVKRMMTDGTRRRFEEVWDLTFNPCRQGTHQSHQYKKSHRESCLQSQHARRLVEAGVATQTSSPGILESIPFTILEERITGTRQRFILWTKEANLMMHELGYKPKVPLEHIAQYLSQVTRETSSQWDLKTGFYQVSIPERSRKYFRFQDERGEWFELTRLPMGHMAAPEIMHSLTATVAGDPTFAKPAFTYRGVVTDIWIDNIRITGSFGCVNEATARINEVARRCNVTWKQEETQELAKEYDFLGVRFDHTRCTVAVAEKLRRRILNTCLDNITAEKIESLAGRLLHASAITHIHPGKYWFALKFFRRVTNSLNRGVVQTEHVVPIPSSVRKEISNWSKEVLTTRNVHVGETKRDDDDDDSRMIFVDASMKGWGAVIFDHNYEMDILGARWTEKESSEHINVLEATALTSTLRSISKASHLDIYVDNTTVLYSTKKGMSVRSMALNRQVNYIMNHLNRLQCTYRLNWVSTKCNPADFPSRICPDGANIKQQRSEAALALGRFFDLRGGGGSRAMADRHYLVTPSPLRK